MSNLTTVEVGVEVHFGWVWGCEKNKNTAGQEDIILHTAYLSFFTIYVLLKLFHTIVAWQVSLHHSTSDKLLIASFISSMVPVSSAFQVWGAGTTLMYGGSLKAPTKYMDVLWPNKACL